MSEWKFKQKLYPHLDKIPGRNEIEDLVKNPKAVSHHTFLPFFEYNHKNRKFKKYLEAKKHNEKKEFQKNRPIKYASHKDAQIFSYYRELVNEKYEPKIHKLNLTDNIIAYRKIHDNEKKGKCNIHFAKEAFDNIVKIKNCVALTFDISGFFESLNHAFLKEKLQQVLEVDSLPADYVNVFKSLTKYSVLQRDDCYEALNLIKKTKNQIQYLHCPKYISNRKKILCSKKTYREKIVSKGLIKKNHYQNKSVPQGVPQGASLSDVLANLYMLDFDQRMKQLEKEINGYYRRYSDDILWICSTTEQAKKVKNIVKKSVNTLCGGTVKISDKKSTETIFFENPFGIEYKGDKFQYLGFRFDGQKAFFRDSTVSRYKRNTIYKIRSFVKRAKEKHKKSKQCKPLEDFVDRSQIFHHVFYRNKKYRHNTENSCGNFMNYYERSKKIFNSNKDKKYPLSEKQFAQNKDWIHQKITEEIKKYSISKK